MATHQMHWAVTKYNESVFYMMNSDQCNKLHTDEVNSYTTLNVIGGLALIVMGLAIVLLNVASVLGLYRTTSPMSDIFRPVIYANLSLLNVLKGLCCVFSAGVLLSNFTWDEGDGAGTFICNLFGLLFTLSIQTKITLITGGLLVTVISVILRVPLAGKAAVYTSAGLVIVSWIVGLIHALLPYMFGTTYKQPDYMTMCIGDFSVLSASTIGNYYSTKLVFLFIPLLLAILLSFFAIPGLVVPRDTKKVYRWNDDYWGTFTLTTLTIGYITCHAAYFIVHLSGMWVIDGAVLIDWCKLQLRDMRYFFGFMVFTIYCSGLAEPLGYLMTNIEAREKLSNMAHMNIEPENRITPLLVDIRNLAATSERMNSGHAASGRMNSGHATSERMNSGHTTPVTLTVPVHRSSVSDI